MGAAITPATAEAATTAGEARYASALGEPMRPLKFRLVAEIPTSPSSSSPVPRPTQGPQPEGRAVAPASSRVFHTPEASAAP